LTEVVLRLSTSLVRRKWVTTCTRCQLEIPDEEVVDSWMNDGLCSWCINQVGKDD
jgi:hypothetical protein